MEQPSLESLLRKLMKTNLSYQLALENYEMDTNNQNNLLNENWKRLALLRKHKNIWPIEKQIQEASIIHENFQVIVNKIGKDNFIFYDDGDINYIWKMTKKEVSNCE